MTEKEYPMALRRAEIGWALGLATASRANNRGDPVDYFLELLARHGLTVAATPPSPAPGLHETHVCRDCGAAITIPYAKAIDAATDEAEIEWSKKLPKVI